VARQTTTSHLATIRTRAAITFGIVFACYASLGCRLVFLQVVRHSYYQKKADTYRVSANELPARRGLLLDRDGGPLAINVPAATVYADPVAVKDPQGTAAQLAVLLHDDPNRLAPLLLPKTRRSHYVALARRVSPATGNAVRLAALQGIGVVADTRRSYPNGPLACHLLGFTNRDSVGVEGLEHSQDSLLHGKDGRVVGEIDKEGRFLPGTLRRQVEPQNGHDLVLTIDQQLQHTTDMALAKGVRDHHARNGVAIVLDPQTGEILALSGAPGYNPNSPRPRGKLSKADALKYTGRWRDSAVSDLYEPGSTLKTITASAVLQEQGLGMMDERVYCSPTLQVGKHVIHEAADALTRNLGSQNLRGVLRVSSNVGMAQFGMNLGADKLYKYEQAFGFLDYPNSGLPGEQRSSLRSPHKFNHFTGSVGWSKIQLANIAFGQGISLTPLQLASAYAAIANNGLLMQPHIVRAVRDQDGETPVAPAAIRQVISPEVARTVRSMLGTVVLDGTGKPAQIAGYSVGGKTGSAQVAGAHGYESGHFVASFVGMFPLSHPRLVILCAVFEPQGIHWGASVAAPVVHDIAKAAMLQMHITPDNPKMADWDDHLKHNPNDRRQIAQLRQ